MPLRTVGEAGGSTDNEFSHLAWRNAHADLKGIKHPLIHLKPDLAQALGVIRDGAGVAIRVTFIIDPEGVIRSVAAYDLSVGRNVKETLPHARRAADGRALPLQLAEV